MDSIEVIHVITEPKRFRLLQLLYEHQYCVHALSGKLHISDSAVSQHMRILKKYRIVYGVKIGYQMHYRVDRELVSSLFQEMLDTLARYPREVELTEDCSCDFIEDCFRRDSKILERQGYGK